MEPCRPILKMEESKLFDENRINKIFKKTNALANPIRIKIIQLLIEHKELCVCELEKVLDLKQSKVSYHLATLVDGGYIKRRQSGPWSFYTLNDNASTIFSLFSSD